MLTFKQILRQSVSLVVKPMWFVLVTFFNFLVSKNRTSPPDDNWTKSVAQRSMVQWALDCSKFISRTVGLFSLVSHMSKFPFVKQQQTVWLSRVEILEILEVHVKGSSEKYVIIEGTCKVLFRNTKYFFFHVSWGEGLRVSTLFISRENVHTSGI